MDYDIIKKLYHHVSFVSSQKGWFHIHAKRGLYPRTSSLHLHVSIFVTIHVIELFLFSGSICACLLLVRDNILWQLPFDHAGIYPIQIQAACLPVLRVP